MQAGSLQKEEGMKEETTVLSPTTGIEGLDELAGELGIEKGANNGLGLEGRSGRVYDLVALLRAHLSEMRAYRERKR